MADNIKVGDVVQLKSGGPKMTVSRHGQDDNNIVVCNWFVDGKSESAFFPISNLRLIRND